MNLSGDSVCWDKEICCSWQGLEILRTANDACVLDLFSNFNLKWPSMIEEEGGSKKPAQLGQLRTNLARQIFCRIYKRFLNLLAKNMPGYKLRRSLLKLAGYTIGKDVYLGLDLIIIDELEQNCPLYIGDRVSIAERVTLVISSRPNFSRFSKNMPTAYGSITIKEDAWLGTGAIILPNVTIGEGAVVGAGSVVNKSVLPFTVVAGVPARLIRKLDTRDQI